MAGVHAVALNFGFGFVELRARRSHDPVELLESYGQYRCTTSVTRMPGALARSLRSAAATLPGADAHYLYPCGDIHLTVASLDSSRMSPGAAAEECARVVEAAEQFSIGIRGLGMTPQSVFARAWDTNGSLARLRAAVARATGCRLSAPRRLLGFVNVLRFRTSHVGELRAGVDLLRRVDFGTFQVQCIQIVQTDKVLSAAATRVLATANLRDAKP